MLRIFLTLTFALILAATTMDVTSAQENTKLEVGDPAPEWALVGSDGKTYSLSDFKGKQAVVVAWYPKALTGG